MMRSPREAVFAFLPRVSDSSAGIGYAGTLERRTSALMICVDVAGSPGAAR